MGSYPPAIKEVFPDARHVQSDGIRALINNNLSERLQGTYRQRTKTLRGLDTIETGQRYLDGWTLTYNLFREHEGIDYDTPGERAKVKPPFTEWEDVVIQSAGPTDHPRTAERDATARMTDADRRNPRIVPDSTQRRRPQGETEADDEEWPRSDSDTDKVERARESLAKRSAGYLQHTSVTETHGIGRREDTGRETATVAIRGQGGHRTAERQGTSAQGYWRKGSRHVQARAAAGTLK